MCTGTHPFIPAPNTAKVRMVYTEFGQELMNVFYIEGPAPWTSVGLKVLCDDAITAWTDHIQAHQSQDVTLDRVEAVALDTDSSPENSSVANVTGSIGNAGAPTNVTLAIKFASGLAGRSQRGRMYFIGICQNQLNGDDITSAVGTAIVDAIEAFFTELTGMITSSKHVIVSYCNAGVWRTTAQNTAVTDYDLNDLHLDSQRRRLAGRGI